MMRRGTMMALGGLLFLLASVVFAEAQDPPAKTLEDLQFQVDVLRANARQPLKDLREQYSQALERAEEVERGKGDLDAVLAMQNERALVESGEIETAEPPVVEVMVPLRAIYQEKSAKIRDEIADREKKLLEDFEKALEQMKIELTKAGEIEQALAVSKKIESVSAQRMALNAESINPESSKETEEVVADENTEPQGSDRISVEKEGNGYVLTSPHNDGRIESRRVFETPFRIEARAATDSTNIRFYFGQKGRTIFNWERNLDELRLHNPVTGQNFGYQRKGDVNTDRMYDFSIVVKKDRVEVYVDRRKRAELEGDFSAASGPIGIGPAFDSRVTVERLVGIQETAEEE